MSGVDPTSSMACPLPLPANDTIRLAHGGGGRLMQQLLQDIFLPAFANPDAQPDCDAAVLARPSGRLAFTSDAFVVRPLFFPGGDIGKLAVCGTVNDLAMVGARPLYLSVAFILEEGLTLSDLKRMVDSMRVSADSAGVRIVTGDTKVVDRGRGDGAYLHTSGVGVLEHDGSWRPGAVETGDVILLSGDIGRHGVAVLAEREGLAFESAIESDCACLVDPVMAALAAGLTPRVMRDCTRGGLASALIELAQAGAARFRIEGTAIPVSDPVRGACELMGLDPLYVANEGCMCWIVPPDQAADALALLRQHPVGRQAECIGEVISTATTGRVLLRNELGVDRILDLLSGEQLPRIC